MAVETKTKTIEDVEYTVQQFPVKKSLKILHRLVAVCAPLLELSDMDEVDTKSFADAVGTMATRLSDVEFVDLMTTLLVNDSVRRDGRKVDFDVDYAGNLQELMMSAAFVIQVNYADFLAANGLNGE